MVGREWKYNKGELIVTTAFSRTTTEEVTTEDGTKINREKKTDYEPITGQIVSKRGFGGDQVHEYLIRPSTDKRKRPKEGEFFADDGKDIWVSDNEIEGKA